MRPARNARVAAVVAAACVAAALPGCSGEPLTEGLALDAGASTSALAVQLATRDAWLDEAQWTQLYVMAAASSRPDAPAAFTRLTQAEASIASAAAPYIGPAQAGILGGLLRARADDVRALVDARLRNDQQAVVVATVAWQGSADEIARFMASLGSEWSLPALQTELRDGVHAMLDGVSASFANDRAGEVGAAARAERHAIAVADLFAGGLAARYPERLGASGMSAASEAFHLELRPLFRDQVYWTRVAIIERTSGENARVALDRAVAINGEITRVFTTVVSTTVGVEVALGLHAQVASAYAYVLAFDTGDPAAASAVQAQWYAAGDRFASLLGRTSSSFSYDDLRTSLRAQADATVAEIDARRSSQWSLDVSAYGTVLNDAHGIADAIAVGLAGASLPQPN